MKQTQAKTKECEISIGKNFTKRQKSQKHFSRNHLKRKKYQQDFRFKKISKPYSHSKQTRTMNFIFSSNGKN